MNDLTERLKAQEVNAHRLSDSDVLGDAAHRLDRLEKALTYIADNTDDTPHITAQMVLDEDAGPSNAPDLFKDTENDQTQS